MALIVVEAFALPVASLGSASGGAFVNFHVLFNLVLVVDCLPFTNAMAGLIRRLLSGPSAGSEDGFPLPSRGSVLDRGVIATSRLALPRATRELAPA